MQQLQPGATLQGGKYRIERVLGQGGFGNTYVGINTGFDERIAIKEFFIKGVTERDETTSGISVVSSDEDTQRTFQEQKEKFKKEAKFLRKLRNNHIVSVHDLFEENGTAYYIMDYIDGENLAERMKRTGKALTEQEVWKILPLVLDALKEAHSAGLLHLDIKPGNIMVDRSGNVQLIDFGASKQIDDRTGGALTGTAVARTPGYAPREQMEQSYKKMGPWTDIYALGATLYAILTNERPPLPSDIDDDDSDDKHEALPMPQGVSKKMRDLIIRLMNTNRNRRPQSVDEVMGILPASTKMEGTSYMCEETKFTQQKKEVQEETIMDSKTSVKEETKQHYQSQECNTNDVDNDNQEESDEEEEWCSFMRGKQNIIIGIVAVIAAIGSLYVNCERCFWLPFFSSVALWIALLGYVIGFCILNACIYKYFRDLDRNISYPSLLLATVYLGYAVYAIYLLAGGWSLPDMILTTLDLLKLVLPIVIGGNMLWKYKKHYYLLGITACLMGVSDAMATSVIYKFIPYDSVEPDTRDFIRSVSDIFCWFVPVMYIAWITATWWTLVKIKHPQPE